MIEKTVLVTGSTDGIGKQTALQLALRGMKVLIHGRNKERGRAVLDEIRRRSGNDGPELFIADLSSLRDIHRLALEVRERHERMDVLINNAGIFMPNWELSEDGIETTLAVNCIAPFLLTHQLLGLLKKAAPSRIINVSSIAHWNAQVDFENLQGEKNYSGFQSYALSKLGLILFTYALEERLKGTGITANCLHPGVISTKLLRTGFGDFPGDSPERGARTSVYLASSRQVEDSSGKYFEDCRPISSSPLSYDRSLQEDFWQVCCKLAGI